MGKAWFSFDEVMVGPEAMFSLETRASLLQCLWKQQETVWDGGFFSQSHFEHIES